MCHQLVNNAAISNVQGVSAREEYKQLYNTNLFGTIGCTQAFVPLLRESTAPAGKRIIFCLLYTSPSPRDGLLSRMPSSA